MSNSPLNTRQITFVESMLRENRYQLITDRDPLLRVSGPSMAIVSRESPHPGRSGWRWSGTNPSPPETSDVPAADDPRPSEDAITRGRLTSTRTDARPGF